FMELHREAAVFLERRGHERGVVLEARAARFLVEQTLAAPSLARVERGDPFPDRGRLRFALHADAIVGPRRAAEARPCFVDCRERTDVRVDAAASRMNERAELRRPPDAVALLDRQARTRPR